MYMNPLYANTYYRAVTPTPVPTPRRLASNNILGSPMPFADLDNHAMFDAFNPFVQYANGMQDTGTRSTSAYSNITDSAAPLFHNAPSVPTYPAAHGETTPRNRQVQFRLPSDQLQMILQAMSPASSDRPTPAPASNNMPPPPLPTLTTVHKGTEFPSPQYPSLGSPFRSGTNYTSDRRAESRYSDVSMHAGCNDFPSCTSEDAEGRLVHSNPPITPAKVVKGKKEGSSPGKRKYTKSFVVARADDDYAEYPPRRSPRLLQHDSGCDGGEVDSSSQQHKDHVHTGEADGHVVVESG